MRKGRWPSWLGRRKPPASLDLQHFRERLATELWKRFAGAEIDEFGDDGLWMRPADGSGPFTFNLARLHARYVEGRETLPRLIDKLAEIPRRTTTATRENLRVLVRPNTFLNEAGSDGGRQICRPIAGALWAIVAVEETDAVSFPPRSDLISDLGLDEEDIWSIALRNSPGAAAMLHVPEPGAVQLFVGEEGEATSALADGALWRRLCAEAKLGLVVVPLEKNVLCVIGSFDRSAAAALPELVRIAQASPDFLSSDPLTWAGGRWVMAADLDPAFAPRQFKH